MPESSDWTTEFPAFRFGSGSIDELFERLERPYLWRLWIEGVDDVEPVGDLDRGVGARFRVVFADGDPSTCEGEIVASERSAEVGFAAVEIRLTPGESNEAGSVLLRVDLAAHGDEVAYSYRLREEGSPGDTAVHALGDRLRALLHWSNGPAHRVDWTIEAAPEAVFETLLRPRRWSEWIGRATKGRVARLGTLPPPPEIPKLAFEPWSASGELDRSGAATGDPDATISAETPWRLIDPAGEGPAPTILLRTIDPGWSVEFMLVWRDAAALDPEAAELDPDEPRCHLRIDLRPKETDPPCVDLKVSSQCTPPQTQQRLGRLGTLLGWLSSTECGDATIRAARIAVVAKLEELNAPGPLKPLLSIPLVVSVVLFIELGRLVPGIREILWILVPVLLIHELGHFIAMRLLGYRDVRMFFIPMLGAAVKGRHFNEPGWKAAVVALAGPLPGIALGVGVMAWYLFVAGPPPWWLLEALLVLFVLNALQLVPIMPFDGGRVVRAVVARRLPWLDFWFLLLGSATLLAGALLVPWRPDWIMLVIGVAMALSLPSHFRQDRLTSRLLREGYRPVAGKDDRISWTDLDPIVERIVEMKPNPIKLADPKEVAEMAVEQYERLNHKPPGLVMSAVFLLAQFGAILLGLLGFVVLSLSAVYAARFTDGGEASRASFSPDGTRIATSYEDGTARVWDAATGNELAVLEADGAALVSVVFSPDGTRIATKAYRDNTARVWDAATGNELATIDGDRGRLGSGVFNSDGTRLATSYQDGTARVWNTATGYELMVLKGHREKVWGVAFSPDGTRIATASWDGTARVWDAGSGEELASLEGHEMGVWGVTFSPDGTRIATVSFDETARVWDAATGQELSVLKGHQRLVSEVAFSPDGTRIATESILDRTVRVWDAATGEELVVLKGQRLHMNTPFSPDSTRIATGSVLERTVRVWDATTGEELAVLDWHEEIVSGYDFCSGVVFSPDGTHVTALSNRGVVRTFDVADGRLVSEIRLRRPIGRLIDHLLLQLRRYVARDRQALESAPSE